MVQTVQKTVKIPHAFLDKVVLPVLVQRQVLDGRDSAENCGVSAVGAGSWTRLLTCPCWPRLGVVEVPQLQFVDWWWQLVMATMSS